MRLLALQTDRVLHIIPQSEERRQDEQQKRSENNGGNPSLNNFHFSAVAPPNRKPNKKGNKDKLNPDAQRLLLELATVNRIQNEVYHANQFDLQNLRLRLIIEEAE